MQTIQQLFEIIFRRRSVSDLNYDPSIAIIGGAVLIAIGAYANSLSGQVDSPMAMSVAQYVLNTVLLIVLLAAYSKSSRAVQVLSALYGVSALIQVVAIGLQQINGLGILVMFLVVWNFILSIVILREGLDTSILPPLLWTLAINGVTVMIMFALFPDFAEQGQQMVREMEQAQAT